MMKISEMLTIDLTEDIKNVIDLEDFSEAEIQSEIENYIITEGLAKEYDSFASTFLSQKKETGAWISGFYGSGKSYFGKILGYLLSNQTICGTPARDRIMQRFTGIQDEKLIKNSLSRLSTVSCRVVFLDIAKQCASIEEKKKGLAYILFKNFLKSLGLPQNEHGLLLYHLLIDHRQMDATTFVQEKSGQNWNEQKTRMIAYTKLIKELFLGDGKKENEYNDIMETIRRDIDQFSPSRLKDELTNYIELYKQEKIIFLFDEASEAINQGKINLLDLEGVSEALSSLGNKVWTIAIAQEKLDDVINNAKINKASLTKVTDRFQTKIHLEATEVDVIIRSRLLKKTNTAYGKLLEQFQNNSGKITEHTLLKAPGLTKTDSPESYATYYPFYKYQFNFMQNFLFGTRGTPSSKVAARGMIITTYDVLKRELQSQSIFDVATAWQIIRQAQPQTPVLLVNRYDNAEKILKEQGSSISGRKLLETIHFLSEASAQVTHGNICKTYAKDLDTAHKLQERMKQDLDLLMDAKILICTNHEYRITSDLEQMFLDEMTNFSLAHYKKANKLIECYKNSSFVRNLARLNDQSRAFDFHISTDNQDDLTSPSNKALKIRIKSIYTMSDKSQEDIDAIKMQYQNDKDLCWVIPSNESFQQIDKMIDRIERIGYLMQNHPKPSHEEKSILDNFKREKDEKEHLLGSMVQSLLENSTLVYLFSIKSISTDTWQSSMHQCQREIIKNIFSRKLDCELSDDIAPKIIKETNPKQLKQYFDHPSFAFFDHEGNFIGDNLKVVEEIREKIKNNPIDAKTLEKELEQAPYGFTYGTVITTLAVLMRAGRIMMRYNGKDVYSHKDNETREAFSGPNKFKNASFKAVTQSLKATDKQCMVQELKQISNNKEYRVDLNDTDFALVGTIQQIAKDYVTKIEQIQKNYPDYLAYFSDLPNIKIFFSSYAGLITDNNYIEKAQNFLQSAQEFKNLAKELDKTDTFLSSKLKHVIIWRNFIKDVLQELQNASIAPGSLQTRLNDFENLFQADMVKNFSELESIAQGVKDQYYYMMKEKTSEMAKRYQNLALKIEQTIKSIPKEYLQQNHEILVELNTLLNYAQSRSNEEVELEFAVKNILSPYSLSEIVSYIDLFPQKEGVHDSIKAQLVFTKESENKEKTQSHQVKLPQKRKMKVKEYREWLSIQSKQFSTIDPEDEVEVLAP